MVLLRQNEIERMVLSISEKQRKESLIEYHKRSSLTSTTLGITRERYCPHEIIVSLTTFGDRIYSVHLAIESIMLGSMKPNRIILWLSEEEFHNKPIPAILKQQQARGLEIYYCKDIRSYKKIIYTLHENPESCIITIDDDAIYESDIINRLVNSHIEHPNAICACRVHRMVVDTTGHPVTYNKWKHCISDSDVSPLNFATGCGGILYPPHSLPPEALNEKKFMELCPSADDVWFYAMALMSNTPVIKVPTPNPMGIHTDLPSSLYQPLSFTNTCATDCQNDAQINAVLNHYNLYSCIAV